MKVFYSFAEAEGKVNDAVLTIGMFDGVHKGHETIINHIIDIASELGGEATLVTFWPHPRQVLSNDTSNLKLINTLEEKIDLMHQTGLQNLIVHPFTIEFSKTSSYDFLQNYLAKILKAKAIVVGKNHFFGHNREGNFEQIREFAKTFSILAKQIPLRLIDEETISSEKVREAISVGNILKTNELLGYKYFVSGSISGATQDGRFHFTPHQEIKLLPTPGVYDGCLRNEGQDLNCSVEIAGSPHGQTKILVDFHHNLVSSDPDRLLRLTFL